MKPSQRRQYIIRGIPKPVDEAIRKKAQRQGKSLNAVLLESIIQSSGVAPSEKVHHDLDFLIGSMTQAEADELEGVIQESHRVAPGDW
jgi:hypothetical protein